jgi:DNA-binding FadR family transcriptional regulator
METQKMPCRVLPYAKTAPRRQSQRSACRTAAIRPSAALPELVHQIVNRFASSSMSSSLFPPFEDQKFHHYFAQVVGAEGMSTIINDAATHLVRIRRLTHPIEGRMQKALIDHQKILDQMAQGNVHGAIAELTLHLSQVFRTFIMVAEQRPEYFQDFNGVRDDIPEAMRRYLSSYVRSDADPGGVSPPEVARPAAS